MEYQTKTQDSFKITQAILLYGRSRGFATIHDVSCPDAPVPGLVPEIQTGRLLTRDALRAMLDVLADTPQRRSILPENILCYDGGRLVWWSPAQQRPIFVRSADTNFNEAVNGKTVWHPPLVFRAESRKLYIYALKKNERPSASTPLFRAPYGNIYSNNSLCMGNVRFPDVAVPGEVDLWEKGFYDSAFTHANAGQLVKFEGGHNGLWAHLATGAVFPESCLLPLIEGKKKLTLEEMANL